MKLNNLAAVLALAACLRSAPALAAPSSAEKQEQLTTTSIVGDPGMQAAFPSVSLSLWNFCNGALGPSNYTSSPSPRYADCAAANGPGPNGNVVTLDDENLAPGTPIPGFSLPPTVDAYAIAKEQYLGEKCLKPWPQDPSGQWAGWSGWSIMFKSGNMNTALPICNRTYAPGEKALSSVPSHPAISSRLRFNNLPMNQPLVVHGWTQEGQPVPYSGTGTFGYYAGTYDVDPTWTPGQIAEARAEIANYTLAWYAYRIREIDTNQTDPLPTTPPMLVGKSFLFAMWYRNVSSGGLTFYQGQATSPSYPWLMNYIRSNQVGANGLGMYGGYDFPGSGVMRDPMPSVGSNLSISFRMLSTAGTPYSVVHFYMPCFGGCWKLDGRPCDGTHDPENITNTDVTRYLCFQLDAPAGNGQCSAKNQGGCPAAHYKVDGTVVYPNNTAEFPYTCYAGRCSAWQCDPYSNPVPQSLLFLAPCEEWAVHGAPSTPGQGWAGDPRSWNMDVGGLGARVVFEGVDPPVTPEIDARRDKLERALGGRQPMPSSWPGWGRSWLDFEIGPEEFASTSGAMLRWETSGWDVTVTQ